MDRSVLHRGSGAQALLAMAGVSNNPRAVEKSCNFTVAARHCHTQGNDVAEDGPCLYRFGRDGRIFGAWLSLRKQRVLHC
jgi:hypothetical protein